MPSLHETLIISGDEMPEDKNYNKCSRDELIALINDSRKEADSLKASCDELQTNARDIRHRIINIFQVITSLLNLQERSSNTEDCTTAFSKSRFRIQMMSVMYEYVYRSPFAKRIALGDYLQTIIKAIVTDYRSEFGKINLFFDMDDVTIQIDQALPIGLIVVECAMNSARHAFPVSFQKAPSLSFTAKKEEGSIVLSISDNGIGIKEKDPGKSSKTLGLFLIDILCRQVQGKLLKDQSEGTRITITFPV